MNSIKLFTMINNYLNQMCSSVDEIKGNYMNRFLFFAVERDMKIKNYTLDYRRETFIEDFFINIFCFYVSEMEKILNKTGFFKKFYKKYMSDSIKLASSRDFLDHSSLDAVMLPIEAALFRFFNYGKSLECSKIRDKIVRKIRKKINRIEINCYDFSEDVSRTSMKFKDLFNKNTYPYLDDSHWQIERLNENIDYIFEEMFFRTSFSILLVEFMREALKENSKLIKDPRFNELKEDIYLYFVRNTGSYISVYDLLSISFNKIQDFIEELVNTKKECDKIRSEISENASKVAFVEFITDVIKRYNIFSILEAVHEFCIRNYKLIGLSTEESKNISDEILFILNKLKDINIEDYELIHGSLVHLSLNIEHMWNKNKEIIRTKRSFELSKLFDDYVKNSIFNNESRLFTNPVFRKYIRGE